jgi:hypothetical protein
VLKNQQMGKIWTRLNPIFADLSVNSAEIVRIAKSRPGRIRRILPNLLTLYTIQYFQKLAITQLLHHVRQNNVHLTNILTLATYPHLIGGSAGYHVVPYAGALIVFSRVFLSMANEYLLIFCALKYLTFLPYSFVILYI